MGQKKKPPCITERLFLATINIHFSNTYIIPYKKKSV
nr:MAG TPA: hypothetical protein [Ackermannviridae sp.]